MSKFQSAYYKIIIIDDYKVKKKELM